MGCTFSSAQNGNEPPALKLRVLDVSKRELSRDFARAAKFRSKGDLFKHVYEEEYSPFGGRCFGLLLGDYAFGCEPYDVYLLEQISHVAAAAHAPCVAAAKPTLFWAREFC